MKSRGDMCDGIRGGGRGYIGTAECVGLWSDGGGGGGSGEAVRVARSVGGGGCGEGGIRCGDGGG